MAEKDIALLHKKLSRFANAKNPIDSKMLINIPYFTEIFPDGKTRTLLVLLSGNDGIAFIQYREFKAGEKLITKDQFDQMIYWVLSGHANVIATIKNQPKTIHKSKKGDCIGALGVLRGTPRNADVVAGENGVSALEIDWSITDKNPQLGRELYHLIALNLANELDNAYNKQLHIISNSLTILHEKTALLVEKNIQLEKLLKKNAIDFDNEAQLEHTQLLDHAIGNIRESLALLESQEDKQNIDKLGIV